MDIKLEVGQQTETITVTASQEVIQTETGAREGVLSSKQIDNLSIMGRSALELLRILPGVVTDFNIGESTGAAKDVQNYTVNGIRSSGNTAQLDGSNLLDIGCNCGMMVSFNNDMISEVKVQSSNFAAEYGAGGMNVSGVTKAGTSSFHGEVLLLPPRFEVRGQRPVELDRGRREAEGDLQVSRLQRRRSDLLR